MTTLNTFNSHLNDSKYPAYTGDYYFYLVDFMDIYSGQHYFRVIDAGVSMSHDERMAHFDGDINGTGKHYDPRYEITAYEIDLEPGEMLEAGLTSHVFRETYWDRVLQGAV